MVRRELKWGNMNVNSGFDVGYLRLSLALCAIATLAVAVLAAPAAAAPPKCHGKTATKWSKKDVPRNFVGSNGPDVFVTGAGDDTITGNGGRDIVCSKGGNDTIDGGNGLDRIYAGSGDDIVLGRSGDDVLCGYGGRDAIFGGSDSDWISVGSGVNFYDADGNEPDSMYDGWVADGYTHTVGIGSDGDDVATGGMIHERGATLDKRWHC